MVPTARPTILTFSAGYLPGYKGGGPIRTIENMVNRLSEKFVFKIVTADRDLGDVGPYEGLELDRWLSVGDAEVMYVSRDRQTLRETAHLLRETSHDVLYLNSFFGARFSLLPLAVRRMGFAERKPTILAPRGELDSGALALKSLKKRAFIKVASLNGLYSDIAWQASSGLEAERIQRIMGVSRDRVFIAADLPTASVGRPRREFPANEGPLRVAFLSRISRKKNLDYALRVFAEVQAPCLFTIHGVIEDQAYWQECERLIAALQPHVRVEYRGALPHDQVEVALSCADLFLFPTRGENYGHVILEALSAGVPVLTSDQTPWTDLSSREAGWVLPLGDPKAFAAIIDGCASESLEVRARRSRMAEAYARDVISADDAVDANIQMFLEVMSCANGALSSDF